MEEASQSTTSVHYLAYVKRDEEANSTLFEDDARRDELASLFQDPFSDATKFPFEGDTQVLADGACYEVSLSQHGIEAMERQYITSTLQIDSLSEYDISTEGGKDISVVYAFDGKKLVFKRVPKSRHLRDSKIVSIGDEGAVISSSTHVFSFDDKVDAVYHVGTKKLYFADFQAAKHVFGTLEIYYRGATQNEVDEWLDPGVFDIDSSFDTFAISTPNRKRMRLATDELQIDLADEETLIRIRAYAAQHAPKMLFINNKFNVKKNADITEALRIITGAYYQNEITGELMVANTPKRA